MKYTFYGASDAVFERKGYFVQPKIRVADKSKLSFIWGVSAFI